MVIVVFVVGDGGAILFRVVNITTRQMEFLTSHILRFAFSLSFWICAFTSAAVLTYVLLNVCGNQNAEMSQRVVIINKHHPFLPMVVLLHIKRIRHIIRFKN